MSDAVFDAQVQANRFFCISCDRDEAEVQDWLRDNPGQGDPDGDCCIAALTGEPLRFTNKQVTAMWDLFEDNPLPASQHPTMTNSNRRYFCYSAIAKFIGAHMAHFKLPECVECHIEDLYPRDSNVAPVGFQA